MSLSFSCCSALLRALSLVSCSGCRKGARSSLSSRWCLSWAFSSPTLSSWCPLSRRWRRGWSRILPLSRCRSIRRPARPVRRLGKPPRPLKSLRRRAWGGSGGWLTPRWAVSTHHVRCGPRGLLLGGSWAAERRVRHPCACRWQGLMVVLGTVDGVRRPQTASIVERCCAHGSTSFSVFSPS